MIARVALAAVVLAGCSRDIALGTADAPTDAAPTISPFAAGSYAASFLDPAQTMCAGRLGGMEADFSGITRAGANLVNGSVTFDNQATTVVLSGPPIDSAFLTASLTLMLDTAGSPAVWDASVTHVFGSGPDSSTWAGIALALDPTTAASTGGVQGVVALLYTLDTATTTDICTIEFGALFVKS